MTRWYYGPPGSFGEVGDSSTADGDGSTADGDGSTADGDRGDCTPVAAAANGQVLGGVPGDGPAPGDSWGFQSCSETLHAFSTLPGAWRSCNRAGSRLAAAAHHTPIHPRRITPVPTSPTRDPWPHPRPDPCPTQLPVPAPLYLCPPPLPA